MDLLVSSVEQSFGHSKGMYKFELHLKSADTIDLLNLSTMNLEQSLPKAHFVNSYAKITGVSPRILVLSFSVEPTGFQYLFLKFGKEKGFTAVDCNEYFKTHWQ